MEEAHVTPAVVVDVLRVAALTHGLVGQSVSLASVARDLLNLVLPKALAVSDWGAEPLSRAQLLYSALDAVVTFLIHQAQERELSRQGRQLRRLMGACVVPVCEMERVGIPLDRDRHQTQIAEWNDKLPQLRDALSTRYQAAAIETVAGLQDHRRRPAGPGTRDMADDADRQVVARQAHSQAQSASARHRRAARTARSENARFDLRRGSL
jgi:ribonuclease D